MVRGSAVARNNGSSLDMIDTHDAATPTGAPARPPPALRLTSTLRAASRPPPALRLRR